MVVQKKGGCIQSFKLAKGDGYAFFFLGGGGEGFLTREFEVLATLKGGAKSFYTLKGGGGGGEK